MAKCNLPEWTDVPKQAIISESIPVVKYPSIFCNISVQ